jgi:hypothetical protein
VCYKRGRYKDAIMFLENAARGSENGLIHYHLGMALLTSNKKKDLTQSANAFSRALTMKLTDDIRTAAKSGLRQAVTRGRLKGGGVGAPLSPASESPSEEGGSEGEVKLPFGSETEEDSGSQSPLSDSTQPSQATEPNLP